MSNVCFPCILDLAENLFLVYVFVKMRVTLTMFDKCPNVCVCSLVHGNPLMGSITSQICIYVVYTHHVLYTLLEASLIRERQTKLFCLN